METTAERSSVVAPGEGTQYWVVGDHMTIKITGDQTGGAYAMGEVVIPPGGGPPPHVHRREDELFHILEGDFVFVSGDQSLRGGPGATLFLPRGVPHAFKNISDKPGRFIVTATPAGFDRFVAEAGCACDDRSTPPALGPADVERLTKACAAYDLQLLPDHRPTRDGGAVDAGKAYWVLGQHVNVRLGGADTGGRFSVAEVTCQPGEGVPPHFHRVQDEVFYVIDGTFEFVLDGATTPAPAGTTIRVPKGVMHGFRNVGPGPARLYDLHTPGGFEQFFVDCGVPCTDATAGPPKGPPDMAFVMRMVEKHGMVMPPPPGR